MNYPRSAFDSSAPSLATGYLRRRVRMQAAQVALWAACLLALGLPATAQA